VVLIRNYHFGDKRKCRAIILLHFWYLMACYEVEFCYIIVQYFIEL